MAITPIGQLPVDQPLSQVGSIQRKLGTSNTTATYGVASGLLSIFPDGSGGAMTISVTPDEDCMWQISGRTLWLGTTAVYSRNDWGIRLNPADKNGDYVHRVAVITNSSIPWHLSVGSAQFELVKNTAYAASLVLISVAAGAQFHFHPGYLEIVGQLVYENTPQLS